MGKKLMGKPGRGVVERSLHRGLLWGQLGDLTAGGGVVLCNVGIGVDILRTYLGLRFRFFDNRCLIAVFSKIIMMLEWRITNKRGSSLGRVR